MKILFFHCFVVVLIIWLINMCVVGIVDFTDCQPHTLTIISEASFCRS